MNATIVQKRKWFWSWQDEKQEAWLSEMSQQGLHLKELGHFGAYRFESGPPKRYAYRMDFIDKKKSDDYFQFIADAGWEHLGTVAGWQYWRKEPERGESGEIFTDAESKIQKYQRLLVALVSSTPALMAMMIIGLAMFKRFPGRHPSWLVVLFISVFLFGLLFAGLNAVMVQSRIKELKRSGPV